MTFKVLLHHYGRFTSPPHREFVDEMIATIDPVDINTFSANQDFVVKDELRLCLEDEEKILLEHEKNIIKEQRFKVEEAKRMRLEEDKLLQIAELKKGGMSLGIQIMSKDLSRLFHSLDTVWLTPDIERFISQQGHVKCKFPWSDDYTVGRNFWLTLACLEPSRKSWLSEEHIELWVDYMWHGRPDNANWAMIIMVNIIPPNHVDDVPVVEPNKHDDVPVVPEPVLVDEDEDPEEEEFEEEEEP
ncbi:hypothetical protein Tco_0167115 [Tanacetum coccineum]